jgi:carboxymethylenebutenolidase
MGAAFSLMLDELDPGSFSGIVMFYGPSEVYFSQSQAKFQCHYAENDEWGPLEQVKKLNAPNAEIYIYPDVAHWFIEDDRPEYNPDAAKLAWDRTLEFFNKTLLT